MRKLTLLLSLLCISFSLFSQIQYNSVVAGYDQKIPLPKAAVTLMNKKDSTLISFTRTSSNGSFSINLEKEKEYSLFVTYPNFLGQSLEISTIGNNFSKVDTVFLLGADMLLSEVAIVDSRAIALKGDTIQFSADKFATAKNASVEDLLKKLPGLQVDSKGNIKAFGEKVEKVFVDGEEFFGNDPTVATKNIQAAAIDKVEVFDKKTEQAELSGIDDGIKVKAINLKLKEGYKNGYFGKIDGKLSPSEFYDGTGLLQLYKGKTKLGFYGVGSNTGTVGIDYEDRSKFLSSSSNNMSFEDGVMMITSSSDDQSSYNGQGLPKASGIGASFSSSILKDKIKFNFNYGYSAKEINLSKKDEKRFFLRDSTYDQTVNNNSLSNNTKHSGNAKIDFVLDSFTTLNYSLNLGYSDNLNTSNSTTNNFTSNTLRSRITDVTRISSANSENTSVGHVIKLDRKFRNIRRRLTFNINLNNSIDDGLRDLQNNNEFYLRNQSSIIRQNIVTVGDQKRSNYSLTYSEPLSKTWVSQFTIFNNYSNTISDRNVFGYDNPQLRNTLSTDSLSNSFVYDINGQGAGINLIWNGEKANVRIGFSIDRNNYNLTNKVINTDTAITQTRFIPSIRYGYKFSRSSNLSINYSGNISPPNLQYLQPIRDISDPLNVTIGNPNLRQSFTQRIGANYSFWKALSGQSLWSGINISNTINGIVNSSTIDADGRNVNKYVNANGIYYANIYGSFNQKIYKNLSTEIGINGSYNQNVSILNGLENINKNWSFSPEFDLKFEQQDKADISISYQPSYNLNKGGVIAGNGTYYSHDISFRGNYNINPKLKINTSIESNYQAKTASFDDGLKYTIWNASISQNILKDQSMVLSLGVNDILNQNLGYRRNVSSFVTSATSYNTIQRYAFLKLLYNFKSKVAGNTEK
jgi:hypothetical protein